MEHPHAPHEEHHGFGIGTFLWVFAILMVLLAVTVVISVFNLGPWSLVIAMIIATVKAALVVMYFMQAKRGSLIIKAAASSAVIWLLIGIVLSFSDYATRRPIAANAAGVVEVHPSIVE